MGVQGARQSGPARHALLTLLDDSLEAGEQLVVLSEPSAHGGLGQSIEAGMPLGGEAGEGGVEMRDAGAGAATTLIGSENVVNVRGA